VRAQVRAGRAPGPESSIGKVHQGELNQRIQTLAVRLLGMDAMAWDSPTRDYAASLPFEVRGMLRSRANTIEGITTEVNRTCWASVRSVCPGSLTRGKDTRGATCRLLMAYETVVVERRGPVVAGSTARRRQRWTHHVPGARSRGRS
jgi:hypothetical protein